ncbi:WXG100 family type VII secretion target [Streptomyces sp. NRRL S-31]|uniref:WXG100 family type VII secretion target n=1 Tax=Streptomyces sp. NRRL S-31 TaxID=1463898 RepID=UPI0004C8CA09|nr:WXG100 family type VII secretion target [Streptomyces sp. NRRL S-31]
MTDNWQQQPEYKTDVAQANRQVGLVNAISRVQNGFRGTPIGAALSAGRTNFENHDLNAMIDLVHHANPEHLETASKALWDARTAIHDAATDLETNLKGVDWEGRGAEQFHSWTDGLIEWTKGLATFADVAATEISAAATGLASVRNSMPERDPRPVADQKRPHELPKAKQVEDDPDYAAALKVEKNRQEAINQVNRLASFYSVSAMALGMALQTDPKPYTPIPDVGVPRPSGRYKGGAGSDGSSTPGRSAGLVGGSHGIAAERHHGTASASGTVTDRHASPVKEVHESGAPSGHDVGTEINTTTTLPPQTPTAPPASPTPTLPTTTGGSQLPPGPMAPPVTPTSGRTPGYGPGGRPPVTAQGRTGPYGSGRVPQGPAGQPGRTVSGGRTPQGPTGQTGRSLPGSRATQGPTGQAARAMGRATPAGQPGGRGPTQTGRSPMGRAVTGGTPKTTGTPGGRTGTTGPTGPARNGVVGGKPVTGRTSGGTASPRVPRGMVVGAEEPASSTPPKGAVGQRGVVGAPKAKTEPGSSQAVLRSASNPEGVIGASRNAGGSQNKGSQTGATGLGRGAVGGRQVPAGGSAQTEQHRSSQQRRDVPQKSD